jgi:hypothetical protein
MRSHAGGFLLLIYHFSAANDTFGDLVGMCRADLQDNLGISQSVSTTLEALPRCLPILFGHLPQSHQMLLKGSPGYL